MAGKSLSSSVLYFVLSLANFAVLRFTPVRYLGEFMVFRGLTAVVLSIGVYRFFSGKYGFSLTPQSKNRMTYGSVGMVAQILGTSVLPISLYALLNRLTPIWFLVFLRKKIELKTGVALAFILFLGLGPLYISYAAEGSVKNAGPSAFQLSNPLVGILIMLVGTALIAFSQKNQVDSVGGGKDSPWLMAFPPAFGITVIGLFLAIFHWIKMGTKISGNGSIGPQIIQDFLHTGMLGLISGITMTFAYWAATRLIRTVQSGGTRMVVLDLSASVALGLFEIFKFSDKNQIGYLIATLMVFFMFGRAPAR